MRQGAVLYLCLEDTYARVKKRLWKLTDEANDSFYLANSAATIRDGLTEQIEYFFITHPDLKLVFIDTFQKVRAHPATASMRLTTATSRR